MSQRSAAARPATAAPDAATSNVARAKTSERAGIERAGSDSAAAETAEPAPLLVPLMPPAPPRRDDAPVDFSRIGYGAPRIHDADAARARLTAQLLREIGQAFGLDLSRLQVTVTSAGGARIDARGASGLQEGNHLLLHPGRYRPNESSGRYLLAHEAAHAAQRALTSPGPCAGDTLAAAEAEADALGLAFAQGQTLRRPRVPLRGHEAAADTGKTAATADGKPVAKVPLGELVKTSRSRELAQIKAALNGWWVSDGDVFKVMRILDSVDFSIAVAMVGALPPEHRYWLADNINPPHMYQHRRSVLASYQALEPDNFRAVDLKVLRALPDSGLDLEETQALIYTIGNLPAPAWEELRASEKGEAISKMVHGFAPDPDKAAKLAAEKKQIAADEATLAGKRKLLLAHADDQGANDLVADIRRRLQTPRGNDGEPRHPYAADAIAVLDLLHAQMADESRFGYIAEQLERAGLIDQLMDLLPPQSFIGDASSQQTETLTALVQTRLSYKNEQLLEDLLSYGVFDWAIREYEALFAYKLLTALPMPAQYQFRQREGGKYYLRLIDNLPRDEKTGLLLPVLEIRKAGSKEELERMQALGARTQTVAGGWRSSKDTYYYNASDAQQERLNKGDARIALQALIDKFADKRKGIYRDAEAIDLYRELVKLGAGSLERDKETAGDEILREAFVRELDSRGYIDELFNQLPESFLFNQENRVGTLKIMLARDPLRVQAQARELVSRGFFSDWMVKDWEAYLAYQCIKALPEDERQAFIRDNNELWKRIHAEMSPSMRQARDINAYVGDKEGTDRASVLAELAEESFWTVKNQVALGSVLRMAVAMSEHRFAYDRSKDFKVVQKTPALTGLIDTYRLWNPAAGRDEYKPEMLKGTRWHEEGIFSSIKSLWGGLVTLWNMDVLFVDGKIGAKVDLNNVQDFMGGDIMGMQLAQRAKRGSQQPAAGKETNQLTLLLDPDWLEGKGKSAELILPQLLIDSTNVQMEGSTVQTGVVDLRNLHIRAAYDEQNQGQAAQAQVNLDSLVANDLLLAKGTAMYTIAKLVVTTLRLAAGSVDSSKGAPPAERKGRYIPFPLLVLAMLPWLAQLAAVALMATGINKVRGLADQGLDADNRFAGDMASRIKAIDMSFASLSAEGFASSGGQRIARAEVEHFALSVGLNKATRLRAELASIAQRRTLLQGKSDSAETLKALDLREAELRAQRVEVEKQEADYLAIQAKIRAGGLTPAQQKQLQQDLDRLDFEDKGGAFLDIGKIQASGIEGTVTAAKPIVLNNIHGQGSSSAMMGFLSGPTATTAEIARRAKSGQRSLPMTSPDRPGDFVLDLGDVHTDRLEISGGVRTPKDIDDKLKDLGNVSKHPELQPLADSLIALKPKAQRYQVMVAMGLSSLSAAELDEFRKLRKALTADAAIIVESIDLTRARLEVDLASGRVGLGAQHAEIAGLQMPQQGISVDKIVADGIKAGAMPANGLLDWTEWKKHLRDADVGVESLQIENARSQFHGLLFEKATLSGAYARIKQRGNLVEAGLRQLNVVGLGVVPRIGLLNQRLRGLREKLRGADDPAKPALEKEIAKLAALVSELQALADQRRAAYLQLQRAKTPDQIKAAKDAVAEADGVIAYDLAQYGVANAELDEFGVRATGAGDVLSDVLSGGGFNAMNVLERGGVTVTGTGGDNQRLFKRLALQHAQTASHVPDKSLTGDAGSFEVGETRLNINAEKKGDTIVVQVPTFEVDSLSLSQFLLTSSEGEGDSESGFQVASGGASGIERLKFSGFVHLTSKVPGSRELSDYALSKVHIEHFELGKLYGEGLALKMFGRKLEVAIDSGSINGIHGDSIDVAIPADSKASIQVTASKGKTGSLGIESIDKLVLGKALVDTWSFNGRIDAKSINVDLLEDGGITAKVGDLDLTDFYARGPDGWVRLNLKDFGAKLRYKDGALDIDDIHFGTLKLNGVHWKVGEDGFVESSKPTTFEDFKLKGRIETVQEPAKVKAGQPAKMQRKITKLRIDSLHVGKVESEQLIYQDGDNKVELRKTMASESSEMVPFAPLYLQNLDVTGLNWTPDQGLTSGKIEIGAYETSAHYSALKSILNAGVALKGTGMSVEVVGPGEYVLDVGKVEKTRGLLHTGKLDTRFGTGAIVGKVALGPDYVEARNVQIDSTSLSAIKYTDGPKKLTLDGVAVGKITLGNVRQNYRIDPDPDRPGKTKKTPTTMALRELQLFDVVANGLDYQGESRSKSGTGAGEKETVSTQHIIGAQARINHLQVEAFDRDEIKGEASVTAKVDTHAGAAAGTRPFSVTGLNAELIDTIGSQVKRKHLISDVVGGPITAKGIKFGTVSLGTGPDGKPLTRTSIDGLFSIGHLGFLNPNLTLVDVDKKEIKLTGPGGSVLVDNAEIGLGADDSLSVKAGAITANKLNLKASGADIDIEMAKLHDLAVGMKNLSTDQALDSLGAKIREIELKGIKVGYEIDRSEPSKPGDPSAKKAPWVLDALGGLSGTLNVHAREVPVVGEVDLPVKIRSGVIDFDKVAGDDGYFLPGDIWLFASERSIWARHYKYPVALYESEDPIPGVTPADIEWIPPQSGEDYGSEIIRTRGQLNLKTMLEGMLNAPPKADDGKPPKALDALNNLTLGGDLSLGDGIVGAGPNNVSLIGKGAGKNAINISGVSLGKNLVVKIPEFQASKANFELMGKAGETGPINLNVVLSIDNLGHKPTKPGEHIKFKLTLEVVNGVVKGVTFGDMGVFAPKPAPVPADPKPPGGTP